MTIKAIETYYNGYRFRSKLEAQWAVFFDAIGIEYEYEPEGFEFEDGTKYLPDFKIRVRHRSWTEEWEPVYVEVKGVLTDKDIHKFRCMFQAQKPLYIVGSVPLNVDECFDEVFRRYSCFYSFEYLDGDGGYPAVFSQDINDIWLAGPDHDEYDRGKLMDVALLIARQVRFDHGQAPTAEEVRKDFLWRYAYVQ